MDELAPGYVAVGRVLGASGTRGAMKVELLAPATVLTPGRTVWAAGRQCKIQHIRQGGRFFHLRLAGIDDREAAARLRDRFLQVPETDLNPLPSGEYYRFQLLGLMVRASNGRDLGRVVDVLSAPENDVYVARSPHGEVLIPAVDDVVQNVDLDTGVITVEIVPGLLA